MRLRELLGSELMSVGGGALGTIHDVRLVQDGPILGSFGAALRLDGFLAGPGAVGVRFGYTNGHVDAPALLAKVFRARGRDLRFASWSDVVGVSDGVVYMRAGTVLSDSPTSVTGKIYDAAFELLDRQLVDVRGRLAGKVDDLGFRFGEHSTYVDTIRSGPGAIAASVGGKPGRWFAAAYRRLREGAGEPASVSFGVVRTIGPDLTLTVPRDDLGVMTFEAWVRDHFISKLPGASG